MPAPFVLSSDLVSAYPAKSVTLADYIDTSLAAKTDLAMTQNAQTGTTYSFALADASKLLTTSNASPVSVTVTKQATVTWVTGTQLRVMNLGAGVTTLIADTGVTINGNVSLKQYQGGTLIRTASDVWLFVPTASPSGMDLITPTSVAGSGVTVSGGKVSFSASTSISVNGCFTATYDNYAIYIDGVGSASQDLIGRLRLSGTDAAGATDYTFWSLNNGAYAAAAPSTGWSKPIGFETTLPNATIMTIFLPFLAVRTAMHFSHTTTIPSVRSGGGAHALSTSYDSISFIPSPGNATGTLRIYGLRNS